MEDQKITYMAYCPNCNKILDEDANRHWLEEYALLHYENTGHRVIIGYTPTPSEILLNNYKFNKFPSKQ
ncbi:hypothetical protein [Alkaliphilus hydrothermalis]|uniref:Uncharacterized protein n=1 Tax=Alkaliphilus hydrothermalis TaxID=1482730 RepID=A0ABS2NSW3_9FIRM|nr:hypothetical protein [Alkaliphilus hydrothermalis]MBM7616042.1 hypothetical protein [Alkaliphilus hydrothermalis]